MNTAHPAARAAFPAFEVCDRPLDMLLSDLSCLDRFNPANPFVARQRRKAFPFCQRRLVGCEGFLQVQRQFVNHALGNSPLAHAATLQIPKPKSSAQLQIGVSAIEKYDDGKSTLILFFLLTQLLAI